MALSRTTLFIVILVASAAMPISAQITQQERVHHMSSDVMPFDVSKAMHIFRMTEDGGVERVIAKEPAVGEIIVKIQQHLQHEAEQFQKGDYADPANLHGAEMPALKELQERASQIKVSYLALPNGAEITFSTRDLHALTAVHRWFGAQLSEHGADARPE